MFKSHLKHFFSLVIMLCLPLQAIAWADWHEGSIEYVNGDGYNGYDDQFAAGPCNLSADGDNDACEQQLQTLTVEYANGWKYGGSYLYVDTFFVEEQVDIFSQGFFAVHLNKVFKDFDLSKMTGGVIQDFGPVAGWQYFSFNDGTCDASFAGGLCGDPLEILTGAQINFGVHESIDFIQYWGMNVGYYHDMNKHTDFDAQLYVDFFWRANWYWGPLRFQADGFLDWYDDRSSDIPGVVYQSNWFGQLQLKWDAGLAIAGRPNAFLIGTEIQFSKDTFGQVLTNNPSFARDDGVEELFPALVVEWVF